MSPKDPAAPPSGAPGALESVAEGIRVAHRNFLRLYPLALLVDCTLLAALAVGTWRGPKAFHDTLTGVGRSLRENIEPHLVLDAGAVALAVFLPTLLVTALVTHAVRALVRGRPADRRSSLVAGLRRLHVALLTAAAFSIVPVAAAALHYALTSGGLAPRNPIVEIVVELLAVLLSALLGAAIVARLALAAPIAVVERLGPIGAWRRSERLVEGSMWRVMALVVVAGLLWLVVFNASSLGAFELAVFLDSHGAAPILVLAAATAVSAVGGAWFHLVVAVVTTLLFDRLRTQKEGPDADELQRVFD